MLTEIVSFPKTLRTILTAKLHLPPRITNALIRANIMTIGDLVDSYQQDVTQIRGIGVRAVNEIQRALITIVTCLAPDDTVDWHQYYTAMGFDPPVSEPATAVDSPVLPFSDNIRYISIGQLHLPPKLYNTLSRANITTIGDVLVILEHHSHDIDRLGTASIELLTHRLHSLADAIAKDGTLDWFAFWKSQQITVIPKTFQPGMTTEQIVKQLPGIIKEILLQGDEHRNWQIIERRFGLNRKQRLTLEEIGQAFGLTRERVRQIEHKVLIELRSVLVQGQYVGRNYHVHPEIDAVIRNLFDTIATQVTDPVPETRLFALAEQVWKIDTKVIEPLLLLFFSIAQMERIEFANRDLAPIWETTQSGQRELIVKVVSQIDHLLTDTTGQAMDEFDLLRHINKELPKTKKITLLQLRRFLELCNTVEQREDGLYQGQFRYLKQRGHQAERLLLEAGTPLDPAEMTREINSRTVPFGAKKLDARNLGNQIVTDDRFVAIGRSGLWALKSWEHIDTASIVDLMERFLIERNKPVNIDEIYEYISSRRPVTRGSISIYLSSRGDLFRRFNRVHWGLASWALTESTWDPDAVASFVAALFKQQKTKEIEFRTLAEALSKAAGVSLRQARGMLNINPVVQTRREGWDKIFAIFQPDYNERLQQVGARFTRKKATRRHKFSETVREILESQTDKTMEIGVLIDQLVRRHGFKQSTAYGYLRQVDFVEKVVLPHNHTVLYRLKGQDQLIFPQIEEIPDAHVKSEIHRAIRNLTLDNVDIGLFLLGRQFEVVIKRALLKGSSKGVISLPSYLITDATKWKLVQMVDGAKQCGLITDLGVANLLRQERNDRAHSAPPSLEERQALINSVQYLAGLYIDYILIFCKHEQGWA